MTLASRRLRFLPLAALLGLAAGTTARAQTAFSAGDLVVYRVGTGAATLSSASTAVFLDEYNTSGALVQSIALPTANSGNNFALTASGSATSEGELNLSADGQYLTLTGYAAAPGVASIASSTTTSTTATNYARAIGIVDGTGLVDTSTTVTAFSGNNIRGAYSDGTNVYAVGANSGVVYTTKGTAGTAGTAISTAATNLRDISVSNGQLYVSSSSGSTRIAAVGTGIPTTGSQTVTNLPGLSSSSPAAPYAFFFASLTSTNDTLYVADTNSIDKFSLVNGSYVATGTITGVSGVEGLTGSVTNGTVNLYASIPTGIYAASDTSGYDGTASGAAAKIVSNMTNEAFRGLAFAPQLFNDSTGAMPEPGALPLVAEAGLLVAGFALARRRCKA